MRNVLLRLAAILLPLVIIGCSDVPTAPLADATDAGRLLSGECTKQTDGSYLCPPISSDPVEPEDPCMTSTAGGDVESVGMQSCPPSGGGIAPAPGDGDSGGDTPIGGGGSPGDADGSGSTAESGTGPYAEGPLLWAACVVAVIGGTYSVDVVADKFVAWYEAHKAMVRARNSLAYMLDQQRRGYVWDPALLEMAYYKVDVTTEARDAAVGAVEEATGVSILTLIGAGLACGAAVAAPTL